MKKMLVTLAFLNTLFFMSTACSQDDSNYTLIPQHKFL